MPGFRHGIAPYRTQGKSLIKTIRSITTTCRRRGPKLVFIGGRVSLLAAEQDTLGDRGLLSVRNLLIPVSTPSESLSLFTQSTAESEKKDE